MRLSAPYEGLRWSQTVSTSPDDEIEPLDSAGEAVSCSNALGRLGPDACTSSFGNRQTIYLVLVPVLVSNG
jgi:hypothetical protein